MTIKQLLLVLWARRLMFFAVFIGIVGLVTVGSLVWPKTYVAEVSVVVDSKSTDPVSGAEQASELMPSNIATQVDVIASHNVALKVVDKLRLAANPAFQERFQASTDGTGSIHDWIADDLLKNVEIKPSRDSHVIAIDVGTLDARFSAAVANAFAESYIQTSLELKMEPARRQAEWFADQLKSLRKTLEGSQAKLSEFQRTNNVSGTNDQIDIENGKLAELSNQLVVAQAAMYQGQTRVKQLNQALSNNSLTELPDITGNPLLQSMKADLARTESKLSELGERFGKNHPQYISALAEVTSLQNKLSAEMSTAKGSIIQSAQLATKQESEIRGAMDQQRNHILELKKQRDSLDVLKHEVENAQRAYDAALQRASQVRLESQLDQSNIAILNPAVPPLYAKYPKLVLNIAISIIVGLFLASAAALAMEMTDRRVRSSIDVIEDTGLIVLAEIPRLARRQRTRRPKRNLLAPRKSPGLQT